MRFCPRCHSIYRADVPRCAIDGTLLDVGKTDPLLGKRIASYTVLDRIGFGSTGGVYRVERGGPRSGTMAMKVLYGDFAANEQVVSRFLGSAAVAANIHHDNVVVPTDYGRTDEGLCYLVMEYVPGRTLRNVLDGSRSLPPNRAGNIVTQIASGLHAAHQAGCVHRDIKPANVLVSIEDGLEVARLVDFGLTVLSSELLHHPEFVGTPIYMAPEIARDASTVSGSADLYALGVMTYEMLAGHPPFEGQSVVDLVMKHSLETPPPLKDAGGLELIINWLLEKKPSARPPAANVLVDEILRLDLAAYIPPIEADEDTTLAPRPAIDMGDFDEEEIVTEDLVPQAEMLIPIVKPIGGPNSRDAILGYEFLRGRFDLIFESIRTSSMARHERADYEGRLETLRGQLSPNQGATAYVDLAGRLAELTGEIRDASDDPTL